MVEQTTADLFIKENYSKPPIKKSYANKTSMKHTAKTEGLEKLKVWTVFAGKSDKTFRSLLKKPISKKNFAKWI